MTSSKEEISDHQASSDRGPPAEAQLSFGWTERAAGGHSESPAAKISSRDAQTVECDEDWGYGPGHPWHYLSRGDNATPIPATAITAGPCPASHLGRELPKSGAKRLMKARQLLESERSQLDNARERYQEVVDRGADALSKYDREIAHGGDLEMARASALALTYNHVRWHLGRIAFLERELLQSVVRWR